MRTKSFKIGGRAIGGIIKVTINGESIKIQALDYLTKEEVFSYISSEIEDIRSELYDWTSIYWGDKIIEYIEGVQGE